MSRRVTNEAKLQTDKTVFPARSHPSEFSLVLRPAGPVLNSHARQGVVEKVLADERRRCGTVVRKKVVPALQASSNMGC